MISHAPALFPELAAPGALLHSTGILPSQKIAELIEAGHVTAEPPIEAHQIQPSSLDLRLGPIAYRVRASFLPSDRKTVSQRLADHKLDDLDLSAAQLFERGSIYIVPLCERLSLPDRVWGKANPKSTTGRLDVFTRLITDHGRQFETIPAGYHGALYAEIVPRTFSIVVSAGARLNQLRFALGAPSPDDAALTQLHTNDALVYEGSEPVDPAIREGLRLSVDLAGRGSSDVLGYRARKDAPSIDLEKIGHYSLEPFWEPIPHNAKGELILNPEEFYILASRERVRIPPDWAAEMIPYDPAVGEFRIHYAGFFDPGFGYGAGDIKGAHAVLEVRSHEVPFLLEDGQEVARLVYERLLAIPDRLYGEGIGSSYQSQGLALSKHFRR